MITKRTITDRRVADPLLRASLVIEAALASILDSPTAVRTVLTAAAALGVVGTAVRARRRGVIDAAVIGLAGALSVLVLLGLVLNLFPAGLTRVSWSISAGLIGLAAVAWGARTTPKDDLFVPVSTTTLLRQSPWYVAAAAVTAVAVIIAIHATDVADRAPVQLSLTSANARSVAVQVTGARTDGMYQLVVRRGSTEVVRSVPFRLTAGHYVDFRFTPPAERVTVDLRKVGGTTSRSLIVDLSSGRAR